jgi:decaprenyl-phosphate phosphoribosyltransferase
MTRTAMGLIKLVRLKQWIKNGFVFGPLVFSGLFREFDSIVLTVQAAVIFCLASSAVYILNDLQDIEADRRHPVKSKKRPLANGDVSPKAAIVLLVCLYLSIAASWFVLPQVVYVVVVYLLINVAYTLKLKQIAVVDIFAVASGFVLRVYAGIVALQVEPSYWMLITTLCLALYLAAIKRRQEMVSSGDEARAVLQQYTLSLVDRYAEMSATGALVFYSMFTLTVRPEMAITVPFVLFGLYRYWYIVEMLEGGESPTDVLLTDWPLLGCIIAWVVAVIYVLGSI